MTERDYTEMPTYTMAEYLGLDEPTRPTWREVLGELAFGALLLAGGVCTLALAVMGTVHLWRPLGEYLRRWVSQ